MSIFGSSASQASAMLPPLPQMPDTAQPVGFGQQNYQTPPKQKNPAATFLGSGDIANPFGLTSGRIGKTLLGT